MMKIFISYARVDKPYCVQIVNTLDVHQVWYDQRLYAGQQWWKEILRRLDWCEGFVYLLSPDSVQSEYCRREFELAESLGRQIIPILIVPNTPIPTWLANFHYIDLTGGLSVTNVTELLNSVYVAEQRTRIHSLNVPQIISSDQMQPPVISNSKIVGQAAAAMQNGQYDHAVFLLRQAKEAGFQSQFINIDDLLKVAEADLEHQTKLREAEREYRPISDLVRHEYTRELGCLCFKKFRQVYPDYDPDGIASICGFAMQRDPVKNFTSGNGHSNGHGVTIPEEPRTDDDRSGRVLKVDPHVIKLNSGQKPSESQQAIAIASLPLLEFIDVPAGMVRLDAYAESSPHVERDGQYVKAFRMTKFPITNRQYQTFIQDPEGYANEVWWRFSPQAVAWRTANPKPKPSQFKGDDRPRETVNWFDAMAFCGWLGKRLEKRITLPTVAQFQRAVQGHDSRVFPWGMDFKRDCCNTRESGIKMTTAVDYYTAGISPYGIYDLAGNVWEWCLDLSEESVDAPEGHVIRKRAVIGGSHVSPYERSQINFNYYLDPVTVYASIGFRAIESVD